MLLVEDRLELVRPDDLDVDGGAALEVVRVVVRGALDLDERAGALRVVLREALDLDLDVATG